MSPISQTLTQNEQNNQADLEAESISSRRWNEGSPAVRRSDEGPPSQDYRPPAQGVGEVSKQKHVRVGVATSDLSVDIILYILLVA